MRAKGFRRYSLSISAAAALLAGCGGSQPLTGASGGMPPSRAIAAHAERVGSWMLPEAKGGDLLYATDRVTASVYSYPRGKLVGELTGFGILGGDCVDKSGDIWILDSQNAKAYEYRHGGTSPIATLSPQYSPLYCSVNSRNGDLAVGTGQEVLLIYHHAHGYPTSYRDSAFEGFLASSYDHAGNLFVDGLSSSYHFEFAELPKDSDNLKNIALNRSFEFPGGVSVIEPDVVVGDATSGGVYQFHISGSTGTEVASTQLQFGTSQAFEFTIHRDRLIAPLNGSFFNALQYFKYPEGGSATKTITNGIESPISVAISKGDASF
jgi:hypothetical protein